jgi:hypothetical protein
VTDEVEDVDSAIDGWLALREERWKMPIAPYISPAYARGPVPSLRSSSSGSNTDGASSLSRWRCVRGRNSVR